MKAATFACPWNTVKEKNEKSQKVRCALLQSK